MSFLGVIIMTSVACATFGPSVNMTLANRAQL
jgi:hypothetical protein